MPEAPEIKLLTDYYNNLFKLNTLINIEILSGKYTKNKNTATSILNLKRFKDSLPLRLKNIKSRGKFIYWIFYDKWFLFMTMGMSGRLLLEKNKYSRIKFTFKNKSLYFSDMRNFGTIHLYKNPLILKKKLNTLGLDFFNNSINKLFLFIKNKISKIRNKNITLCKILLNQNIFCGVGNYIRSEALFISKISPFLMIKDLDNYKLKLLIKTIKTILNKSYSSQLKCLQKNKKYIYEELTPCYNFKIYSRKYLTNKKLIKKKKCQGRTVWYV